MTVKQAIYADVFCWIALISAIWVGPTWMTKVALTICMVWNMMCIIYLAKKNKCSCC